MAYAALALFAMSDTVTRFTEYVARPRVDCDVVEAMQLALKPFHMQHLADDWAAYASRRKNSLQRYLGIQKLGPSQAR